MKHTAKLLALLGVAALLPEAGCNDPLRVSYPDVVQPNVSDTSLVTLRAGALGDFAIAYTGDHPDGSGGTGEGVIEYGGLLADEFFDSETFPTRIEVDARTIQVTNSDVDLWYRLLHRARQTAETAAGAYAKLLPRGDPGYPEMLDLAGYTYIFFAETFCSGVPVSHLNADATITYGHPLTTVQLLDTAVARFQSAILVSTDAGMTNFATVGIARAQLDLGQFATAAATAASVPTSFAYVESHSVTTDRENNGVYNAGATDARYSVADKKGTNGFAFRSAADARTPFDSGGIGFDGVNPLWGNLRYGGRASPITVATGAEARLIRAEAALQTGDTGATGQFLAQLNVLRDSASLRTYFDPNPITSGAPAIGPLRSLTTADITAAGGAVNLLFAERARWLWLTAHRLGDLRRLVRQYGRPQNTVFPSGPYPYHVNFAVYGTDVNIPVPITEQNNRYFTACLDRNP